MAPEKSIEKSIAVIDTETTVPAAPLLVAGANHFTGVYTEGGSGFISFSTSAVSWKDMWRQLGLEPPGPLPAGAQAIFHGHQSSESGISYVPRRITFEGGDINIDWDRQNIPKAEQPGAASRFSVLVLPKGNISERYTNSFPLEEERQRQAMIQAEARVFSEGIAAPVRKMRPPVFKR